MDTTIVRHAKSRFTTLRLHALAVGGDVQDSEALIYSAMEKLFSVLT